MAKVFTQEEREKIKGQVVELVHLSGRETLRQLEAKTGATRYLMSVLARELVASGDVYNSGYGLFPSEQARKDWQNARKKLSRAKVKKTVVVDPDLIWPLPDGDVQINLGGSKPVRHKFKSYPIGYFHIDIAELQTAEGKFYLLVAIDRTSNERKSW